MGVVTDSVIDRMAAFAGKRFHWTEWRECAATLELVVIEGRHLHRPAYIIERFLVFRAGLSERKTAELAWEEIGHHLTCAGNRAFWATSLPGMQGELTLARFERRAKDIAEQLPRWDD